MAVLITGFTPFGGLSVNPSAVVAEAVARRPSLKGRVAAAVLPTEYRRAGDQIAALLRGNRFDACVCLGVGSMDAIHVETTAYNLDDSGSADNAGEVRVGSPIVAGAPVTLQSTLPVASILAAIAQAGVPVALSDDPGRYVCNHVFYRAVLESRSLAPPVRCGFIHIPMHTEAGMPGPSLPLHAMIDAVVAAVAVL